MRSSGYQEDVQGAEVEPEVTVESSEKQKWVESEMVKG